MILVLHSIKVKTSIVLIRRFKLLQKHTLKNKKHIDAYLPQKTMMNKNSITKVQRVNSRLKITKSIHSHRHIFLSLQPLDKHYRDSKWLKKITEKYAYIHIHKTKVTKKMDFSGLVIHTQICLHIFAKTASAS